MAHYLGRAVVFAWCLVVPMRDQAAAQAAPPTYSIGAIPPLTAYEGQPLTVRITGPALGVPVTFQVTPPPLGRMTMDRVTGIFTYVPQHEDRSPFNVTFAAVQGTAIQATQIVLVSPTPALRPEYDLIQYQRPLPDETLGRYITYTESYDPKPTPSFNLQKNLKTRAIEISGRTITIDATLDTADLLKRINGVNGPMDIAKLTIYAETVIIRSRVKLPGTDVVIFAKELTFEDRANEPLQQDPDGPIGAAAIVTTPLPDGAFENQVKGSDGIPGQNAGNIVLHIQHFTSTPAATNTGAVIRRFVLTGGSGQDAGASVQANDGTSYPVVPFPRLAIGMSCQTGHTTMTIRSAWALPAGTVFVQSTCGGRTTYYPTPNAPQLTQCPTDASPAQTAAGKPGVGGDAGSLSSPLPLFDAAIVRGGRSGTKGKDVTAAKAGAPDKAVFVDIITGTIKTCGTTKGYAAAAAPAPDRAQGGTGAKTPTAEPQYSWLHPYALRQIVAWATDAYRDGNLAQAAAAFSDYLPILTALSSTADGQGFVGPRLEIEQFTHQLASHLDYYGNPSGWVPFLSLQTYMQLLDQEANAAVPLIYLSERIFTIATNEEQRQQTLKDTVAKLSAEINDSRNDFTNSQVTLATLSQTAADLSSKINDEQLGLTAQEQTLNDQARQNVINANTHSALEAGLHVLSAVCQAVPLFQPVLGSVGKGLDLLANIDTTKPLATVQKAYAIGTEFTGQAFSDSAKQLRDTIGKLDPSDAPNLPTYVKTAAPLVQQFAQDVDHFRQEIQDKGIPQDEIETQLKQLEAQDDLYKRFAAEIRSLNDQKAANTQKIAQAIDQSSKDLVTIDADVAAITDFQRAYSASIGRVDHSTAIFMRDLERRQIDRLQKYLYFMAKAYEYRLLKPYTGDLRLDSVLQQLRGMLRSSASSAQGGGIVPLTQAELDAVIGIYRDAIRTVIADGVDQMSSTVRTGRATLPFGLNDDEIRTLNDKGQISIDLHQRIAPVPMEMANRRLISLQVAPPGSGDIVPGPATPDATAYVRISATQSGETFLTSGSSRYVFRFGMGDAAQAFRWGATYDLINGSFKPDSPSLPGTDLLDTFLDAPVSTRNASRTSFAELKKSVSQFAESSADTTITIRREIVGNRRVSIVHLYFNALVDYVPGEQQFELNVRAPDVGEPYIVVNRADVSGRTDGRGAFRRIYNAGEQVTVQLTAPLTYSGRNFTAWVDASNATISTAPTLNLVMSSSRTVRPSYR